MKKELLCQAIYYAIRSRNKVCKMGYSRKNPNRGLRIWNFQGYQRNSMRNFQGLIKKLSGISKGDQEKTIQSFQGSLFLALEFPRDLTQFCGISLFCLKFTEAK